MSPRQVTDRRHFDCYLLTLFSANVVVKWYANDSKSDAWRVYISGSLTPGITGCLMCCTKDLHSPYIYGRPIHIRQDQTPRLSMGSVPSLNPSISVTSTTASFTKLKVDSLDYCEGGLGLLCEDSFNAWYGASI